MIEKATTLTGFLMELALEVERVHGPAGRAPSTRLRNFGAAIVAGVGRDPEVDLLLATMDDEGLCGDAARALGRWATRRHDPVENALAALAAIETTRATEAAIYRAFDE